jgi:hypothetical protein
MELEIIIISKISQTEKDQYCMFLSYVKSRPKKSMDVKGGLLEEQQEGEGERKGWR